MKVKNIKLGPNIVRGKKKSPHLNALGGNIYDGTVESTLKMDISPDKMVSLPAPDVTLLELLEILHPSPVFHTITETTDLFMPDIIAKYPILANIGLRSYADNDFNSGYGDIEYFNKGEKGFRYGDQETGPWQDSPNFGESNATLYNPTKFVSDADIASAIALDGISHGLHNDEEYNTLMTYLHEQFPEDAIRKAAEGYLLEKSGAVGDQVLEEAQRIREADRKDPSLLVRTFEENYDGPDSEFSQKYYSPALDSMVREYMVEKMHPDKNDPFYKRLNYYNNYIEDLQQWEPKETTDILENLDNYIRTGKKPALYLKEVIITPPNKKGLGGNIFWPGGPVGEESTEKTEAAGKPITEEEKKAIWPANMDKYIEDKVYTYMLSRPELAKNGVTAEQLILRAKELVGNVGINIVGTEDKDKIGEKAFWAGLFQTTQDGKGQVYLENTKEGKSASTLSHELDHDLLAYLIDKNWEWVPSGYPLIMSDDMYNTYLAAVPKDKWKYLSEYGAQEILNAFRDGRNHLVDETGLTGKELDDYIDNLSLEEKIKRFRAANGYTLNYSIDPIQNTRNLVLEREDWIKQNYPKADPKIFDLIDELLTPNWKLGGWSIFDLLTSNSSWGYGPKYDRDKEHWEGDPKDKAAFFKRYPTKASYLKNFIDNWTNEVTGKPYTDLEKEVYTTYDGTKGFLPRSLEPYRGYIDHFYETLDGGRIKDVDGFHREPYNFSPSYFKWRDSKTDPTKVPVEGTTPNKELIDAFNKAWKYSKNDADDLNTKMLLNPELFSTKENITALGGKILKKGGRTDKVKIDNSGVTVKAENPSLQELLNSIPYTDYYTLPDYWLSKIGLSDEEYLLLAKEHYPTASEYTLNLYGDWFDILNNRHVDEGTLPLVHTNNYTTADEDLREAVKYDLGTDDPEVILAAIDKLLLEGQYTEEGFPEDLKEQALKAKQYTDEYYRSPGFLSRLNAEGYLLDDERNGLFMPTQQNFPVWFATNGSRDLSEFEDAQEGNKLTLYPGDWTSLDAVSTPMSWDEIVAHESGHSHQSPFIPRTAIEILDQSHTPTNAVLPTYDEQEYSMHDNRPDEKAADLSALRYLLKKYNIIDSKTTDVMTPEIYEKADLIPEIHNSRFMRMFNKDNVIKAYNTIAYNGSYAEDEVSTAAYGGKLSEKDKVLNTLFRSKSNEIHPVALVDIDPKKALMAMINKLIGKS